MGERWNEFIETIPDSPTIILVFLFPYTRAAGELSNSDSLKVWNIRAFYEQMKESLALSFGVICLSF